VWKFTIKGEEQFELTAKVGELKTPDFFVGQFWKRVENGIAVQGCKASHFIGCE